MIKTIIALSAVLSFLLFPISSLASAQDSLLSPAQAFGCEDLRDSLFESLREYLRAQGQVSLRVPDIQAGLHQKIHELWGSQVTPEMATRLSGDIYSFYRLLLARDIESRDLGALRVGDKSRPGFAELQRKISSLIADITLLSQSAKLDCRLPDRKTEAWAPSEQMKKARAAKIQPLVYGARKALATAYQSCQALALAPMKDSTPDAEGVEETGNYPGSWTGKLYAIKDHEALRRTHYYIKAFKPAPGCVDVKQYSMIYDFGGKPFTTSDPDSSLNYWRNNGDGSPGLGIDCSGYVFTSIAAAGLRLQANKRMKAAEVEDYPASMYINPADNGFSCLQKPPMGKSGSLRAGDIIASKYHVALIESVGADPFGIKKYSDCDQITYRDFDFVIAQSSPDHGVIGINRYEAKEYLSPFLKFIFRGGLEQYAREACKSYQAHQDSIVDSSSFGVSRHKLTPECLQNEIKLESQACIESCNELYE